MGECFEQAPKNPFPRWAQNDTAAGNWVASFDDEDLRADALAAISALGR